MVSMVCFELSAPIWRAVKGSEPVELDRAQAVSEPSAPPSLKHLPALVLVSDILRADSVELGYSMQVY